MTYAEILQTIDVIATVVGLIFVVVSLQQTRKSINAATYQHILEREAQNWNQVRTGDVSVRVKALQHFGVTVDAKSDHSDVDVLMDHISLFNFYEGIFFLQRQGAVNKEVWQNWHRSLVYTMKNPDIRKDWEKVKGVYNPLFMDYVAQVAPSQA